MFIGERRVSLNFLSKLINEADKVKHRLVKSDIYRHDKQNFASCEKISRGSVIETFQRAEIEQ